MAKKVIKKAIEEEIEIPIETPLAEIPKEHPDLAELKAIHAGLTKFGIRDIGQLEVTLSRMI